MYVRTCMRCRTALNFRLKHRHTLRQYVHRQHQQTRQGPTGARRERPGRRAGSVSGDEQGRDLSLPYAAHPTALAG